MFQWQGLKGKEKTRGTKNWKRKGTTAFVRLLMKKKKKKSAETGGGEERDSERLGVKKTLPVKQPKNESRNNGKSERQLVIYW